MARRTLRRTGAGGAWRWGRAAIAIIVLAVVAWLAGLVAFAGAIPEGPPESEPQSDAIVVLTGGSGRLETGFELLARRRAQKLFVSGVYRGVEVAHLLQLSRHNPDELICCVKLGYAAESTAGNAEETAAWIADEKFTSLILVTASYHMPRSILEFSHAMPDVRIAPFAVFPANFKAGQWWLWPGSASLVIGEYAKYLLAWTRHRALGFVARAGSED